MAKSIAFNQTQSIRNVSTVFSSADVISTYQVAITSTGSNLTPGSRTFTAAGGTTIVGGAGASTWTLTAVGDTGAGAVTGFAALTQLGEYAVGSGPTAAANAATVDSGSSNATFSLSTGQVKQIFSAGTNDSIITALNVFSQDTAAKTLTLLRNSGNYYYPILQVTIPARTTGTPPTIDLLSSAIIPGAVLNSVGKRVYPLAAGSSLYVAVNTITTSCLLTVSVIAEDF